MTNWIPDKPRASKDLRNSVQKASVSAIPQSIPTTFRRPSWVTPTATTDVGFLDYRY
jgi:hypothetical protein